MFQKYLEDITSQLVTTLEFWNILTNATILPR